MKKYETFKEHYGSVGIVFIYENKVLIVHPTFATTVGWSYPKGHLEEGETHSQTAIRELNEELNIKLPTDFLDNSKLEELEPVNKWKRIKHYWYYKYELRPDEFNKYFNNSLIIPELQLDEIDEARFVDFEEAKKILDPKYLGILQ